MSFNCGVAVLLAIIACWLTSPANAELVKRTVTADNFVDPVADPAGLLPAGNGGHPLQISEDDRVGREPTSKAMQLYAEANTVKDGYWFIPDPFELFADSVARSIRSGDSIAYQLYNRLQREFSSPPPDPTFDPGTFIARHRKEIPGQQESQFHFASSDGAANLILQNMQQNLIDQEMLVRRAGRPIEYRRPVF
jgi:hypothetical protein